jgi:predicted Zn-dependent peptidase
VFREFEKVRTGDVTSEEVEDTKRHLKGRILLGLETSASKMMRLARNEIYFKRQISERELIRQIDAVTRDDLLDLAQSVLAADRNTIVSVGPSASGLHV